MATAAHIPIANQTRSKPSFAEPVVVRPPPLRAYLRWPPPTFPHGPSPTRSQGCRWLRARSRFGVIALAGGLSILLGYRAKIGACLIALFLIAVTPVLHNFWTVADPMTRQMQMMMFMKNVAMLGGALLITQQGAGPWSLDNRKK